MPTQDKKVYAFLMLKSLLSFNFVNYFKFQGKVGNRYQIFFSPLIVHISICNAPAILYQSVILFLQETAIHGFHVADNIKYMQSLEKRYRKIVLPDMMHVTSQ
jgi:hypothetical protein